MLTRRNPTRGPRIPLQRQRPATQQAGQVFPLQQSRNLRALFLPRSGQLPERPQAPSRRTILVMRPRVLKGLMQLVVFVAAATALLVCRVGTAAPDRTDPIPERAKRIDVAEHLGTKIQADLGFADERGRFALLGDYFDGKKPVIVTMNYSNCPMLCSLHLNGLAKTLSSVSLTMGAEYRVVTISFDPQDTSERLARMQARFLHDYKRGVPADQSWSFLHGSEANVRAIAAQLGISYAFNEERKEYLHPAVAVVLSPTGVVSRYLYGLELNPQTTKLSLVEASQGKTGSSLDRLILFCFHYDSSEGKYAPFAVNMMRIAGGLAAFALGSLLCCFWFLEARKRKSVVEVHP